MCVGDAFFGVDPRKNCFVLNFLCKPPLPRPDDFGADGTGVEFGSL